MTYVVTDACIKCKYMDCVEVCPVDCFYEGENMLVINPSECIDCGVCEPECPAEAILPDTESGLEKWLELNTTFSAEWPNITRKSDAARRCRRAQGRRGQVRQVFLAGARHRATDRAALHASRRILLHAQLPLRAMRLVILLQIVLYKPADGGGWPLAA